MLCITQGSTSAMNTKPGHIGIVACTAEGAALCYRRLTTALQVMRFPAHGVCTGLPMIQHALTVQMHGPAHTQC